MLKTGSKAPDFTLKNQDETPTTLSSFAGAWVVVYFYPKALTPGCTTQACAIRDNKTDFDKENINVLGISPDNPSLLKRFEDKKDLNFTLLSDETLDTIKTYQAWGLKKFMGKEYEGVYRITYIIDPDGKIVHTIPKVKTKTHHSDVLTWIQENK